MLAANDAADEPHLFDMNAALTRQKQTYLEYCITQIRVSVINARIYTVDALLARTPDSIVGPDATIKLHHAVAQHLEWLKKELDKIPKDYPDDWFVSHRTHVTKAILQSTVYLNAFLRVIVDAVREYEPQWRKCREGDEFRYTRLLFLTWREVRNDYMWDLDLGDNDSNAIEQGIKRVWETRFDTIIYDLIQMALREIDTLIIDHFGD